MDEHAYEARAFAMAVAEEVETLGRACADRIVVDLTIGTFRVKARINTGPAGCTGPSPWKNLARVRGGDTSRAPGVPAPGLRLKGSPYFRRYSCPDDKWGPS